MPVPEYDNLAKWAAFFRRLPLWLKTCAIVLIVAVVSMLAYDRFGPIREIKSRNESLQNNLDEAKSEISKLRDQKNELHRENLHLKGIMAPIQKKAELLYPELETAAAIAKLAEDLEMVRTLATRDVYKPLEEQKKSRMIAALRILHSQYYPLTPSVTIVFQQSSSARAKVADDLKKYLEESGYPTKVNAAMIFYSEIPPDISIKLNPEDVQLAQGLTGIIGTLFINKQFAGIKRDKFARGHLEITINGDPLFTEDGVVTFR
jgi:hypothetical protein